MLIDARSLPDGTTIETAVCIIGAGAAGITLAREFIGQPFQVCLLESGGLEFDKDTQSLYKGENIGRPYFPLDVTRLRYFGGTTNHWGGVCRPLDDIDFEKRDWIPYSGWPFHKSHLDPFYERAQSLCQLGPFAYDVEAWETADGRRLPFVGDTVITSLFQSSPPTRFGTIYRNEIARADNVSTYLYANVVEIETTSNAQTATRVNVACLQGNKFSISGRLFILATGGIENPRLLLLSNKVQSAGLGNHHGLIGRFYMEHPYFNLGSILPSNTHIPMDLYTWHKVNKVEVRGVLTLSPKVQKREKLLNHKVFLSPLYSNDLKGTSSVKLLLQAISRRQMPDSFMKHLSNTITNIDDIASAAYGKLFKKGRPIEMITLSTQTEAAPNPDSKVALSPEQDALGKNRVQVQWESSPIDKLTLRRTCEIIGQELGRAGLGRLKITLDEDSTTPPLFGGGHHMGTTRMHIDPAQGVVNENCRVHGIANLFIAGSSVFPTVGHVNPTLTIVALALRLADHVKRLII